MSSEKKFIYQSLAQALSDQGVDTLFGLMGDANLFMVNAFVEDTKGEFVPSVHEGSSVLMALAYAEVSGNVGVSTITHGPALTNCVTALTEGVRGRVPIVLMAGDTAVAARNHLQGIDQHDVVKVAGAGFEQVRSPQTATHDLAHAFYRAKMEKRPIVLNMPAEFMWDEVEHKAITRPVFDTSFFAPEGDMVDEAIGMVASAKRPLILAGFGARKAAKEIAQLADRLEAPLATTLRARGLFKDHPYCIDICGTLSTPGGYEAIDKADCIICFGAGLNDFTTDRGKLFEGKRIVQIDTNPEAIGKALFPTAALVADAGLTANNFIHWLNEAEIPASGFTKELDSQSLKTHPIETNSNIKDGTVDYASTLVKLEEILPENRLVVTDGGRFMTEVWCRISVPDAQSAVDTVNFGSIGLGLPSAIGAGMTDKSRPVILFTGDGGFMMGGINEFNTAVRTGLDLIVVLCNDAAYGAEHIQFKDRGMDPSLSTFQWPSFAKIAEALGGTGIEVKSADDLTKIKEAISERTKPLLIELHLDPDKVPRMRV